MLIIGGLPSTDDVLSFCPDSGVVGEWLVNGTKQTLTLGGRNYHVAGVVQHEIMVAGGHLDGEGFTSSTELFGGQPARFNPGNNMRHERYAPAGATLGTVAVQWDKHMHL